MNDEIKEILECMEEIADCTFTTDTFELNFEDTKILLDYITNLQQENDMLKQGVKDTYDTTQEMLAEKQQEIERLKAQVNLLEDNRLFLNKKIGQAIKSLKQECMFLEEWHYDGYDPQLEIIIGLLEER